MKADPEIDAYFDRVSDVLGRINRERIGQFVAALMETYEGGATVFAFGNGGSGGTASHFCGDLVKGVSCGRERGFKAICLNDNSPAVSAIANDMSYDDVFVEQLRHFVTERDLVIGISCSGNSENVVRALKQAKRVGARTVALCGFDGGQVKDVADLAIHADVQDMEVSEDVHSAVCHCVKRLLMNQLDGSSI